MKIGYLTLALGLTIASSALAEPTFLLTMSQQTIPSGGDVVATLVITNTAPPITGLATQIVLPAGLAAGPVESHSTTCVGLVTNDNDALLFTHGRIGVATCTVNFRVHAAADGTYALQTSDITWDGGTSPGPEADLTVSPDNNLVYEAVLTHSTVLQGATAELIVDHHNPGGGLVIFTTSAAIPLGLTPLSGTTDCLAGSVTVNGSSLAHSGWLFGGETCTVTMYVAAESGGRHILGLSSSATAKVLALALDVTPDAGPLSKRFTGDPISSGPGVTLEYTVTNTDRAVAATDLAFADNIGFDIPGAVVSGLPDAPCGAGSSLVVSDNAGTNLVELSGGALPPGASCKFTVSLAVPAGLIAGSYASETSTLTGTRDGDPFVGDTGFDTLVIRNDGPLLEVEFEPTSAIPGADVALKIMITNPTASAMSDVTFVSELIAGIPSVAVQYDAVTPCGDGSELTLSGAEGGKLSLVGADLAPSETCEINITLTLPLDTPNGINTLIFSGVTGSSSGATVTGADASISLPVVAAPSTILALAKDALQPGETTTAELTISVVDDLPHDSEDIGLVIDLEAALPGLVAGLPIDGECGANATLSGTSVLTLTGARLEPGQTCTFTFPMIAPPGAANGESTIQISDVTAIVGGVSTTRSGGEVQLEVSGMSVTHTINDGEPVYRGAIVPLSITVSSSATSAPMAGIALFSNLNQTVSGMAAVAPLPVEPCGAGSALTGTTFLILTGGSLQPGESCTFEVLVAVPAGAAEGDYPHIVTYVNDSDGQGTSVVNLTIQADPIAIEATWTDSPAVAGGTATLEFKLSNSHPIAEAIELAFTASLDDALSGMVAVGLPQNGTCGSNSTLTGTDTIVFADGQVGPASSCTFSVTVAVPDTVITTGDVVMTTSDVLGSLDGGGVVGNPATAALHVDGVLFERSVSGTPLPSQQATINYTISNLIDQEVDGLSFVEDLNAILPGLTAVTLPGADACGAGSSVEGSSIVSLTEGVLPALGSCTFTITVLVPFATVPTDHVVPATDLFLSGLLLGTVSPDTLTVLPIIPTMSAGFAPNTTIVGASSTLTITIDNSTSLGESEGLDVSVPLSGLAIATPSNAMTTCVGGTLTAASGEGTFSYSGGRIPASSTCIVGVDVVASALGEFAVIGALTSTPGDGGTATATLSIQPAPTVTLSASPTSLGATHSTELTLTMDNTASSLIASNVDVTIALPAELRISAVPNPSQTCTGGIVTAVAGTGVWAYTGGSISGGGTCTITVSIDGLIAGPSVITTGDVTSSSGNSGSASVALTIEGPPQLSLQFDPAIVGLTQTSTLRITLDNSGHDVPVSGISLSVPIDGLTVGDVTDSTCGEGALTIAIDKTSFAFEDGAIAANATCVIELQVSTGTAGQFAVDSGVVNTSNGPAASVSGSLQVEPPPLVVLTMDPIMVGTTQAGVATLTVDNSASEVPVSQIDVSASLPEALVLASNPSAATTCIGGTLSAEAGAGEWSYIGGGVSAGATCTLSVAVTSSQPGTYVLKTGELTSTSGNSGTAEVTLNIEPPPALSAVFAPLIVGSESDSHFALTIDNTGSALALTDVAWSTELPNGLVFAEDVQATHNCGAGVLTLEGSQASFSGGAVDAAASCTVGIDVTAVAPGTHTLTVSNLTSAHGPSPQASAQLTVEPPPVVSLGFEPNVIGRTGSATLRLVVENGGTTLNATGVEFALSLPGTLEFAADSTAASSCVGDQVALDSPSQSFTYQAGAIAPGASCTIEVTVVAPEVGSFTASTGSSTSSNGAIAPASAALTVEPAPPVSMAFLPPVIGSTQVSTLRLTFDNTNNTIAVQDLEFDIGLPDGMLVAVPTVTTSTCGEGEFVAEGTTIGFQGGGAEAGQECEIRVNVTSAIAGLYDVDSGEVTTGFGPTPTASATLKVEPPPTLSAAFEPAIIGATQSTTLTLTLDNTVSVLDAGEASVSVVLPPGLLPADSDAVSTTCGGAVTLEGPKAILSDGVVTAGETCTVTLTVLASEAGEFTAETSPLETSNGASAGVTAELTASGAPLVTASLSPEIIAVPDRSTWTWTLDHTFGSQIATNVSLSTVLPPGVAVAEGDASTTCDGGVLDISGTEVALSAANVPTGTSCTVSIVVKASEAGSYLLETGELTSSNGQSSGASSTLAVQTPPTLRASLSPTSIVEAGTALLTISFDNSDSALTAKDLLLTVEIPPGLQFANDALTTCGSVITDLNSLTVSGEIAAGAKCEASIVLSGRPGQHTIEIPSASTANGSTNPTSLSLEITAEPVVEPPNSDTSVSSGSEDDSGCIAAGRSQGPGGHLLVFAMLALLAVLKMRRPTTPNI